MSTNIVRNNPMLSWHAIQKNILEHISLMAQEQIQLEFRDELMRSFTSDYNSKQLQWTHRAAQELQQLNTQRIEVYENLC